MKLLFLSHYGANPQFQKFFAETARQSQGTVKVILPHEIVYTNGWRPQFWSERRTVDGVEYIPGDLFDKKRYHLSGYFPELPNTIWRYQPDAVIVTDEVYTLDACYVILWKIVFWPWRRFQLITWSQAHYMEASRVLRWQARPLLWFNKHFIKKFVTRNTKLAERIRAVIPAQKKVQVVYWSTDPKQFKKLSLSRTELLQQLNLPSTLATQRLVGFVGRLVPEKGVLEAAQAMAQLPNTTLLIIGNADTPYATQLRAQSNCLLLGDKPYEELVAFYNLIDVFILPTRNMNNYYELFGRVLPEAMMCRTLVLGSTNGAIPEVINNPACLFAQNQYGDFTQKLEQLLQLSDQAKQTVLDQNYRQATAHFTVAAFARDLLTLVNA